MPVRPGLSGHSGSVSFRYCNNTTKYLRHSNFEMFNEVYDNSRLFELDSTFIEHDGFFPGTTSYESVNLQNRYIRHSYSRLRLDTYSDAQLFKQDASFYEV